MGPLTRLGLLGLVLFAGCVKIPEDEAYCLLDETPSLDETVQVALSTGGYVAGDFPSEEWWELFEDTQLSELIGTALCSNPTLQMAQARVEAAEQEATAMRSRLFPTIGFNVGVNWRYLGANDFFRAYAPTFPASIPEYLIDVDFTYEFDFWGKNKNKYRAALGEMKANAADYEGAKLILTTSISAVYFKLQALMEKLHILTRERDNLSKLLKLTELRKENALDDQQAVLTSEEHLYLIDQNVLVTEEQIKLNRHMLNRLIGEGPDTSFEILPSFHPFQKGFPLPQHLSSDLLARRPDLMAMIWRVEQAAYLVGAAKADFYPRIDLKALAGLDSVFFNKIFTGQSFSSTVYPALHLPIFTAGRIKANLRAREAEFHESIYAYNNALLNAVQEVADQMTILQKRDERLQVENQLLLNRINNQTLVSQRFQNALASQLELLETQNEVFDKRFQQIGMQYEKILAIIQLIKALGGGYCTEERLFG